MRFSASFIAAAITVCVGVASGVAQAPQETSAYDLVDVGPVPIPGSCSCIATPFAVPYRPGWGYGGGSASPLVAAALSPSDIKRAIEERQNLANHAEQGLGGNPHASLSLAMHLSLESAIAGLDLRTEEQAVRWLHLAATQEHQDAFRLLGYRYARGRGVEQNASAAAYWFHHGATRGDPLSMVALGLLHAAGRGVPQDWSAAVRWWQRAAARHPLGSRFVGDAYACGLGVDQDSARAVAAYKAAVERGELSSSTQLGSMYAKRCAEAPDAEAIKAYQAAADEGFPEAQIALSDLLRQGRGGEPDPYMAYTWARLAELRLPAGELKTLASARAKDAARLIAPPDALAAQEALVQALIKEGAKPIR